jgi:hypothetical protein
MTARATHALKPGNVGPFRVSRVSTLGEVAETIVDGTRMAERTRSNLARIVSQQEAPSARSGAPSVGVDRENVVHRPSFSINTARKSPNRAGDSESAELGALRSRVALQSGSRVSRGDHV